MATIRDRGVTTLSVCKDTKQRLIELADGAPLYEYIDALVEKESQGRQSRLGSPDFRQNVPATKEDINAIGRVWQSTNAKIEDALNRLASIEKQVTPNGPALFRIMAAPAKPDYTPAMLKADIIAKKAELSALLEKAKNLDISVEKLELEARS